MRATWQTKINKQNSKRILDIDKWVSGHSRLRNAPIRLTRRKTNIQNALKILDKYKISTILFPNHQTYFTIQHIYICTKPLRNIYIVSYFDFNATNLKHHNLRLNRLRIFNENLCVLFDIVKQHSEIA